MVWQKDVVRFMRDWSENIPSAESLTDYVAWHQTQRDSTDVYECKRYAVALFDWCMAVSSLNYMILTIDCANAASCRVAEKSGFMLFEKRTPIGHIQPNMVSDSYFYDRKYRRNT